MNQPTKEDIYDEQIGPLIKQIVEICQANNIAMIASFATPNEDTPDLVCTTALLSEETNPPLGYLRAIRLIVDLDNMP